MRDCREQRQAAPEHGSERDDELAGITIGERADERSSQHVEPEEGAGEESDLLFRQMEFILHQRLHREQHVAVRIVQQVERG